jgi:predicted transglutaminase-like cysteine proteinase
MGLFGLARELRACFLACCIVSAATATGLAAPPADSVRPAPPDNRSAEPFGLSVSLLSEGGLYEKWLGLGRNLGDELLILARCREDRTKCESPAALQFLAIVETAKNRDGRARLGEINRAINLAIRPVSDLSQYGVVDVWSPPLATFSKGAGDCEDYAIAKLVALHQAGIPPEDVKLLIVNETTGGEDHAVVAARLDGHWLVLDNRRMAMVEDVQVANYRPIFLIDAEGVKRYGVPRSEEEVAWVPDGPSEVDSTAIPMPEEGWLRPRRAVETFDRSQPGKIYD